MDFSLPIFFGCVLWAFAFVLSVVQTRLLDIAVLGWVTCALSVLGIGYFAARKRIAGLRLGGLLDSFGGIEGFVRVLSGILFSLHLQRCCTAKRTYWTGVYPPLNDGSPLDFGYRARSVFGTYGSSLPFVLFSVSGYFCRWGNFFLFSGAWIYMYLLVASLFYGFGIACQ